MKAFQTDSPFNEIMSRIGDLAVINLLWVIGCLPIITIGASTSAMYGTIYLVQQNDGQSIIHTFVSLFIRRFATTLQLTILFLIFIGLSIFDVWQLSAQTLHSDFASLTFGIVIALSVVILLCISFIFPLSFRSTENVGTQIKRSFILTIQHPFVAMIVLALTVLPGLIATFMPGGLFFTVFFWGILLSAVSSWLTILLFERAGILRKENHQLTIEQELGQ